MTDPEAFLRGYHDGRPGSMADSYLGNRMSDGRSSYEFLADQVAGSRRVLDIGCADGTLLSVLAARGATSLAGVDLSAGELALARARLGSAELRVGRAQELPFAAGSFDAVVCHMALMLMSDVDVVVGEVARVLGVGGRFAVAVSGEPVSGGALELFLSVARPVFSAQPPDRMVPRMGDRRTRTRVGLTEVLLDNGFVPLSWEDITLVATGTAAEAWSLAVSGFYDTALLDTAATARLREEFFAVAGDGPLDCSVRLSVAVAGV